MIADHVRTVSFSVGDGALPSNEGRGYVLRRLLRRAVRYAKLIDINRPFMYELVPVVGEIMKDYYPEVEDKSTFIQKVIKNEEERFHETLSEGLSILSNVMEEAKRNGETVISGKEVFRLYDTYGFPADLTEEYVTEKGFTIDEAGFEKEMAEQRERARAARKDSGSMQTQESVLSDVKIDSEFTGYEQLSAESAVEVIVYQKETVDALSAGREAKVILNKTPFYAESGGQVADQGSLTGDGVYALVKDVQKAPNGQHLHTIEVKEGTLKKGMTVQATVEETERIDIVKNHTSTHLLHQALKDVLGEHVNQAGSL